MHGYTVSKSEVIRLLIADHQSKLSTKLVWLSGATKSGSGGTSPLKMKGRPKKPESLKEAKRQLSDAGDHRHKKSEQEEDEELLSDAKKSAAYVTR